MLAMGATVGFGVYAIYDYLPWPSSAGRHMPRNITMLGTFSGIASGWLVVCLMMITNKRLPK